MNPSAAAAPVPQERRERSPPQFDAAFRERLDALFAWRRDVRRFRTDPLPQGTVERLVRAACLAPSVGLSQPWRFVLVETDDRRRAVIENFLACNAEALASYGPAQAAAYARLKLAGLREAPGHLAVFADTAVAQGHGLGRRTMPETLDYSVVGAVSNLWLAARAEGIGVGWVSILEASAVCAALATPPEFRLIAYLCLGYPEEESEAPELERAGWERRRAWETFLLRR